MSADLAGIFDIDDNDAEPTDLAGGDCRGCGHPGGHHNGPDKSCAFAGMCNCRGWNVPVKRVDASCAGCDPVYDELAAGGQTGPNGAPVKRGCARHRRGWEA